MHVMMIIWDEEKNVKLRMKRNISFEEVSEAIIYPGRKLNKKYRGEEK